MKTTNILAILLFAAAATTSAQAGKKKHKRAERNAAREELRNHQKDTHGGQGEIGKDHRPADVHKYANASIARIKALLKAGKITAEQGTTFKTTHTAIVTQIKADKDADQLTQGKKAAYHNDLEDLSDAINKVVTDGDKDDKRTPNLNKKQHRFEEKIEFGVKSGRLSNGQAAKLRRDLARLERKEASYKNGASLSERERTKLHEEILEIQKDLNKELRK